MRLEREHWPRLIAEFVVIFLSVILALLADDWRDYRQDRADERANLELIVADIREDGENLRAYARQLEARDDDAVRFLRLLDDPAASTDSLWVLMRRITRDYNHRPVTSAFDGLREAGRLELIQDAELRARILNYSTSPSAIGWI